MTTNPEACEQAFYQYVLDYHLRMKPPNSFEEYKDVKKIAKKVFNEKMEEYSCHHRCMCNLTLCFCNFDDFASCSFD